MREADRVFISLAPSTKEKPVDLHKLYQETHTRLSEIVAEQKAILDQDQLSDDDQSKLDGLEVEYDKLDAQLADTKAKIERQEKIEERAKRLTDHQPRLTSGGSDPQIHVGRPNFESDPMAGFASPKEMLSGIMESSMKGFVKDERLKFLAVGSDEQSTYSDPHGGYAVPEGMLGGIRTVDPEVDPLASRVTRIPMETPKVSVLARVDKNHNTSVSGGLTVSRREESGSISPSRMSMEKVKFEANSLFGLNYQTEELLQDSPSTFAALVESGFRDEIASAIMKERINGTGVGEYEGLLNSPCKVSVAKESMQAADTINGTNIAKMRARAYRYSRCVWLANHDTYIQLCTAHIATSSANTDVLLFHPENGTDVPATLLGRPIFFTEYAKTLGDEGDIILVDPSEYYEGTYQEVQSASSIHVRFLNHERAFKLWTRNDAKTIWRDALDPVESATTLSPVITLAARA